MAGSDEIVARITRLYRLQSVERLADLRDAASRAISTGWRAPPMR